jgi:hypothetical protein
MMGWKLSGYSLGDQPDGMQQGKGHVQEQICGFRLQGLRFGIETSRRFWKI